MSGELDLSVVIPAYDEAESLPTLAGELKSVLDARGGSWEILFVDDGSRDGTAEAIAALAAADPRIKGLSFRRNFGKSAALATGFRVARGRLVVTMDADLQDDPAELPGLITRLEEGFDLVSGWK
ncbi:MAG: glycosyltransferase family 2 protein [Candidatus Eisenbacteria bacterium]